IIVTIVAAIALLAGSASAEDIRVLPVKGNIYVLVGGGANIVASVGKDGVLLVDSGTASLSDKIIAKVQELSRQVTASAIPQKSCAGIVQGCVWWNSSGFLATTAAPGRPKPVVGIINTSFDADHAGGN